MKKKMKMLSAGLCGLALLASFITFFPKEAPERIADLDFPPIMFSNGNEVAGLDFPPIMFSNEVAGLDFPPIMFSAGNPVA